jgi:hypothetical protein
MTLQCPETFALCVLSGRPTPFPGGWTEREWRKFLAVVAREKLESFFYAALSGESLPPFVKEELARRHHAAALVEDLRRRETQRVLEALDAAGLRCLVVKGAAVSLQTYEAPHHRPRADTDLWIEQACGEALPPIFSELGYERVPASRGLFIRRQVTFERELMPGVCSLFDVHWKLSDRVVLADCLAFGTVYERGVALTALGASARAPDAMDALLIACLHQVGHHPGAEDWVWSLDLHRLTAGRSRQWLAELGHRARAAGLSALVDKSLREMEAAFGLSLPPRPPPAAGEASARLLRPGRRRWWSDLLEDLLALESFRDRFQLLKEHAFPPADFLRYREQSEAPLPWLYLRRALRAPYRLARRLR